MQPCKQDSRVKSSFYVLPGMQVSTVMGLSIAQERAKGGWIEGAAIWVAVIIVVGVGAGNDWQKVGVEFPKPPRTQIFQLPSAHTLFLSVGSRARKYNTTPRGVCHGLSLSHQGASLPKHRTASFRSCLPSGR